MNNPDESFTTWNSARRTFELLADYKEYYLMSYMDQHWPQVISLLSNEFDFIYMMILRKNKDEKNKLDALRKKIDGLEIQIYTRKKVNSDIINQIKNVRRAVWDYEVIYDLSVINDGQDLSNVPLAAITGR